MEAFKRHPCPADGSFQARPVPQPSQGPRHPRSSNRRSPRSHAYAHVLARTRTRTHATPKQPWTLLAQQSRGDARATPPPQPPGPNRAIWQQLGQLGQLRQVNGHQGSAPPLCCTAPADCQAEESLHRLRPALHDTPAPGLPLDSRWPGRSGCGAPDP